MPPENFAPFEKEGLAGLDPEPCTVRPRSFLALLALASSFLAPSAGHSVVCDPGLYVVTPAANRVSIVAQTDQAQEPAPVVLPASPAAEATPTTVISISGLFPVMVKECHLGGLLRWHAHFDRAVGTPIDHWSSASGLALGCDQVGNSFNWYGTSAQTRFNPGDTGSAWIDFFYQPCGGERQTFRHVIDRFVIA
jgi:hypothetical protein